MTEEIKIRIYYTDKTHKDFIADSHTNMLAIIYLEGDHVLEWEILERNGRKVEKI